MTSMITGILIKNPLTINIGNDTIEAVDDSGDNDILASWKYYLGQSAKIVNLSIYVPTAAGNMRLGIYNDGGAGGDPGTKLAETPEITAVTGWNNANVVTPILLTAGNYWIALNCNNVGLHFMKKTGPSNIYAARSVAYGILPSTWGTVSNRTTSQFSYFATLTV